jgi:GTPase SAR1 family protein
LPLASLYHYTLTFPRNILPHTKKKKDKKYINKEISNYDLREVPMVLVGNKCDLEAQRVIPTAAGEALARKFGDCGFVEASAKERINVDQVFYDLIRQISRKHGFQNNDRDRKKDKKTCVLL